MSDLNNHSYEEESTTMKCAKFVGKTILATGAGVAFGCLGANFATNGDLPGWVKTVSDSVADILPNSVPTETPSTTESIVETDGNITKTITIPAEPNYAAAGSMTGAISGGAYALWRGIKSIFSTKSE